MQKLLPEGKDQGNEHHLAGTHDQQCEAPRVFATRAVDEQDAHQADERAPVSDNNLCRSPFDGVPEVRAQCGVWRNRCVKHAAGEQAGDEHDPLDRSMKDVQWRPRIV